MLCVFDAYLCVMLIVYIHSLEISVLSIIQLYCTKLTFLLLYNCRPIWILITARKCLNLWMWICNCNFVNLFVVLIVYICMLMFSYYIFISFLSLLRPSINLFLWRWSALFFATNAWTKLTVDWVCKVNRAKVAFPILTDSGLNVSLQWIVWDLMKHRRRTHFWGGFWPENGG